MLLGCNNTVQTSQASPDNETSISVAYHSKMTKSDKRKYYNENDDVIYEVKYKPEGFKLRTPSSDLLWKIKLYDTKIKISDNEENLNPYEIKLINQYEAKLVKEETEIARIQFDAAQKLLHIKGETEKKLNKESYQPSILVDMISQIPEIQRNIIKEELNRKGY